MRFEIVDDTCFGPCTRDFSPGTGANSQGFGPAMPVGHGVCCQHSLGLIAAFLDSTAGAAHVDIAPWNSKLGLGLGHAV